MRFRYVDRETILIGKQFRRQGNRDKMKLWYIKGRRVGMGQAVAVQFSEVQVRCVSHDRETEKRSCVKG